jgi:succinoglycan biosynthesis protein ExoO
MNAQIAIDNLEVMEDGAGRQQAMFDAACLEACPALDLAEFIGGNIMFEGRFSFGYVKPVFKRSFLQGAGLRYHDTLRIGEDYLLLASALARGGLCVVEPRVGYSYHIRRGSISRVLELHHVEAMLDADEEFIHAHELDGKARAAQARRTRSLRQAASFLLLVRHLKDGAPLRAAGAALRDPAALRHLRMPVAARLRRLAAALQPVGVVARGR